MRPREGGATRHKRHRRGRPPRPPDSERYPGYPGDGLGEKAWGCRAVGAAKPHVRTVTTSIDEWLDAHGWLFYCGEALENLARRRIDPKRWPTPFAEVVRLTAQRDEAPIMIRYRFDTAYNPPKRFAAQLARRYPHLYIRLSWEGETPNIHGMVVHAPEKPVWAADTQPAMPPHALLEPATPMQVHRPEEESAPASGRTEAVA